MTRECFFNLQKKICYFQIDRCYERKQSAQENILIACKLRQVFEVLLYEILIKEAVFRVYIVDKLRFIQIILVKGLYSLCTTLIQLL